MLLEIVERQVASKIFHHFDDCFSDAALVETCLSFLCKGPEGLRKRGVFEHFTGQGDPSAVLGLGVVFEYFFEIWRCFADCVFAFGPLFELAQMLIKDFLHVP